MKSPYVNELEPNQTVQATFLVQRKEVRQKKTGEPYLALLLADRTGDIDTKMWDNAAEVMDTFDRDDFVRVKGLYQIYQNRPQLTLHKLQRVDEREVDFKDFFPASQFDPEAMFGELQAMMAEMRNPHLKALLDRVFADPELTRAYKLAPAAKQIHHAWLSGLLEHVLSLARLAKLTAAHYPFIDGDLLLTGVLLHDIGKVAELVYDRSFSYSDEGQLLGHIYQGAKLVSRKIQEVPEFPPRLEVLVEHMILSHHGELEYGSPKVPLFAEALLLHHLDNLDSKMEVIRGMVANDKNVAGHWTSYHNALDRAALKKDRYLEGPSAAPASPAPAPAARTNGAERPGSPFASKLQAAMRTE